MVEITDFESATAWLESKEQQICTVFAARSALRSLPGIGFAEGTKTGEFAFASLRAVIISVVAANIPTTNTDSAAAFAARFAHLAAGNAASSADSVVSAIDSAAASVDCAYSAAGSAVSAASATLSAAQSAARSTDESAPYTGLESAAYSAARSAAYSAASADATSIDGNGAAAIVFEIPLWPEHAMPTGLQKGLTQLHAFWQTAPEVWGYWQLWYDGFMNGRPVDWDVQMAIAELPNEDWNNGPEWVAKKIDEIEARVALQKRIAELEVALLAENSQQRGIGDNHPPEPIEDINELPPELVVVWEQLQSIRQETEADVPNTGRVQRAISTLVDIAASCGAWTWEKANMFLDAGLKAGGAAASVALVTGHGDKIVAVIKSAMQWLAFWS